MSATDRTQTVPSPLRRFLKTPKGTLLAILSGLTLLAALRPQHHEALVNALVAVLAGVLFDGLIAAWQKRKHLFSDGAVITGLIVADVLSHMTPWPVVVATTLVALLSKHLLKVGRKPIFNPAAFGLLVAIWVFHTGESWWGSLALMPTWMTLLVIVAGFFMTVRVRKFPQVVAFLGTYFVLLLVMAVLHLGLPSDTPGDALRVPFVNSALFLSFFMVTDPPTSPVKDPHQLVFGVLAAVVATAMFASVGGLAYLLVGLLVANLWKVVWIHGFNRESTRKDRDRPEPLSRTA